MASIRARSDNRLLFFDLQGFRGQRCREQTSLPDTPREPAARWPRVLRKIKEEIEAGTFDYARNTSGSKLAIKFGSRCRNPTGIADPCPGAPCKLRAGGSHTSRFANYAETWIADLSVGWRRTSEATVRQILDQQPDSGIRESGGRQHSSRVHPLAFGPSLAKYGAARKGPYCPRAESTQLRWFCARC